MPFASTSTVRSTQRDAVDEPDGAFADASESVKLVCSQTLTVRSKEDDAMILPNSGCAQLTFVIAASWAYTPPTSDTRTHKEMPRTHLPIILNAPRPLPLV